MVSTRSRRGRPLPPPVLRRRNRRGCDGGCQQVQPAPAPVPAPRQDAQYGPNDACKRHRKPDDQEKTVRVRTYVRRAQR